MKNSILYTSELLSPAYVYDQVSILGVLDKLVNLKEKTACLPLYSIKSANMIGLLEIIKPYVSGFSCSSSFEAQLSAEVLEQRQTIHITTPGYRHDEWDNIIELCDFVTLNSINQWETIAKKKGVNTSLGIRLNPELSFVNDERYDPCRPDSKLGITFKQLAIANLRQELDWECIKGVHLHNNCESIDYEELKQSVEKVMTGLSEFNLKLKWINLGGGYLLNDETDLTPLEATIKWLQDEFNVDVYLEPGRAITAEAGYLVSTVIDIIKSKNKIIVVLDTTINHLPEVFEYQYQPKIMTASDSGKYEYRLVGCSCLSGDLFGDYYFDKKIEIGSRVVFENIGAYMQVKANMFNGINLPATYLLCRDKKLKLIKKNDYETFRDRV